MFTQTYYKKLLQFRCHLTTGVCSGFFPSTRYGIFSTIRRQPNAYIDRFYFSISHFGTGISNKIIISETAQRSKFFDRNSYQHHHSVFYNCRRQVTVMNNNQSSDQWLFSANIEKSEENMAKVPTIKLNNGMEISNLGLGTSRANDCENTVKMAIDCGYRLIDTAFIYGNEKDVGKAIKQKITEGVIKREDIFVATKLWSIFHEKDKVEYACRKSLENLGLTYIDLYLMHLPVGFVYIDDNTVLPKNDNGILMLNDVDYLETYKAMEKLINLGLVKSIGVSNFNSEQIERVLQNCKIKPVVNEIECHPGFNQKKLIQFCKERDIAVMAYCPLGRPNPAEKKPDFLFSNKIKSIGEKHNKTSAQIVLRYLIENEVIPIPRSTNKERMTENLNIFNFKLTEEEIHKIDSFHTGERVLPFRLIRAQHHKYYPFYIEF